MPRLDRLPAPNRANLLNLPVQVNDTSPFTRLATPLAACRLAIVTTVGALPPAKTPTSTRVPPTCPGRTSSAIARTI